MRRVRLYNLILPLFVMIYLPPFIFIPLLGNLIIDVLVYYLFLHQAGWLPPKYQLLRTVLLAWAIGFIADLLGAALLITAAELLPVNLDLVNIWTSPQTVAIFIITIILVGWIIYLVNHRLLTATGAPPLAATMTAAAMGVITAPWFYLLPTTWLQMWLS